MDITLRDEHISRNIAELVEADTYAEPLQANVRPWPPVMIRNILNIHDLRTQEVHSDTIVGEVTAYLSSSPNHSISIYDTDKNRILGIAVDDDVMALIKRDGIRALDHPIIEAVQRNRPICSMTDSPVVVLQMMREAGWDRIGVSEHGEYLGILHRRELVRFLES